MGKKIGIIFADNGEFLPFKSYVKRFNASTTQMRGNEAVSFSMPIANGRECNVIAVRCGIGKVNATTATAFLVADDEVDIILNAGFSGAISAVHRGDIVAGTTYIECDFDLTPLGYSPAEKFDQDTYIYEANNHLLALALQTEGVISGKLGTGDIFLTDKEKKLEYKNNFNINAFDMETAAIASVCHKTSTPFLSLRKISDDADDSAIEDYREMNENADVSLTNLLIELIGKL